MSLAEHGDVSVRNRTHMRDIPGLNSSLDTDNPELLLPGFLQLFFANFGIVPINRSRLHVTQFQCTIVLSDAGQRYN